MVAFFAKLAPTVVGMEACGAAHYWARVLGGLGHEVRLIAPQHVKPTSSATRTTGAMPKGCARR
jgi:transposase